MTKSFGDLVLFENISLGLSEGQRVGLIAKNGSGKTTLLNILSGKEGYDNGTISFRRDLRVGYLEQDPQYPEELTVLEACFHHGNSTVELIKEYERCMETEGHPGLDEILVRMDHEKAWEYEQKAKQILSQLKIRDFSQHVKHLSGGQLKRVALANTLITEPDLLILDEPTNHLDLDMTEWLEEYLRRNNLSLLMVTHDRYFLDRVCSEIVEIDNRQIYQYKGNYSYYLEKRQERIEAKTVEIERANNLYRTELEWMRRMPQARGHKARYREDAFYELEKVAKQRFNNDNVKLDVKASYIGSKIFEADHLYKSFGDLKILDDFSYIFSRYEKMGIVGNNGTGKSTFIKILMGLEQADSGTLDIGETVRFGYYSQDGLQFDEQMKVIDVVQDIAEVIELGNGKKLTASQFLQHFLFTPETQHSYVYKLSGGERRRLYLCTVLMRNPNFLVLMADPEAGVIGAAHCGRRGLQKGVIGATIEKMVSKGAQPERIVATLGPCICGDCYEVGGDIADEFDAQFPGTFTLSRFGQPGIDIAAAALQELAKAGVPADNIVSSRPRVNAATQYLSEDEELAGICAADGEGDPKLSERFNKIRRSLCTLENPLWFSHRRASLAKKQHEGRMLALIVRE